MGVKMFTSDYFDDDPRPVGHITEGPKHPCTYESSIHIPVESIRMDNHSESLSRVMELCRRCVEKRGR